MEIKEKLINWLDTLLIIDIFVVFIGFLWFAIGVTGRYLGVNLGFDLWYQLWQPLFNPAIAILIMGAILSWVVKKINQKFTSNNS